MRALFFAIALVTVATGVVAQDHGPLGVAADAVKWGSAPAALPSGGQMAILSGDPGKPGLFTVRLKMPAGYKIPPHQHPHSEQVTVISGEMRFGTGEKLEENLAKRLGPGGFVDLPANVNHYAFVTVETVIQISAEGPFGINYANPADDPSKRP